MFVSESCRTQNVCVGGGGGGIFQLQCHLVITLCLRSIGMDRVISGSCYKGTILQKKYRKMTIKWSFSYNSFVKFHGKIIWLPQHDCVISKSVLKRGAL